MSRLKGAAPILFNEIYQTRAFSSVDTRSIQVFTKKKEAKDKNSNTNTSPLYELNSNTEEVFPISTHIKQKDIRDIHTSPLLECPKRADLFSNQYAKNNYSTNATGGEITPFYFPLSNLYRQTFYKKKKVMHKRIEKNSQALHKEKEGAETKKKVVIEDYEYTHLNRIAKYLERMAHRRAVLSNDISKVLSTQPISPNDPKLYSLVRC